MPEGLRPGEEPVENSEQEQTSEGLPSQAETVPEAAPYPLASLTTPEQVAATATIEPETYPIPTTDSAVERMQFLARDLAALQYEVKNSSSEEEKTQIATFIEQTKNELASLNSDPTVRDAYQEYFHAQVELAKQVNELAKIDRATIKADQEIKKISRRHSRGLISSYIKHHLKTLEQQKATLAHQKAEALANPETELGYRSHQLREYRRQFEAQHFVETPSRREYIDRLQDLWTDGKKTLLTGPTGTGKTELAKQAAREYSGEPEIISGTEGLTTYDVYGKPKLGPGQMTPELLQSWEERITSADEAQRDFLLAQFQQQGGVVSGFTLGKLPQAAQDGHVVVYDEIDLIPSKTLLRHKADFNLRAGETFTIQEDSNQEIKINDGFAVAATANLKSAKHKERQEIDPAILRLLEPVPVEYFSPPELYDICLAGLIDRRGALEMSQVDAGDTLARLVQAAIDTQEAYLGQSTAFFEKGGASTKKLAHLDKAVLDPGRLVSTLGGYRREALRGTSFKQFIEAELVNFINNEAYSEKERFTLLDIFTQHGFLLSHQATDFLPAQLSAEEFARHVKGKSAVVETEPSYLNPRQVAELDPFQTRSLHVQASASEFLAQAEPVETRSRERAVNLTELERRLNLAEQYGSQINSLENWGVLEPLKYSGGEGIEDINNDERPVPSFEEVKQHLENNAELVERKIEQGFTKLLLVPIGASLDMLTARYGEGLMTHAQAGALEASDGSQLELNTNEPVWVWDKIKGADKDGGLIYYPKAFDANHGGLDKNQLIQAEGAWQILLVEDLIDLPAVGQGQTIGGRKQLGANLRPIDYLATIDQDPIYVGESGLTLEGWLALAMTYLYEQNIQIDDYLGNGKTSYLVGNYLPTDSSVPIADWFRRSGARQAFLSAVAPGNARENHGCRAAVKI